MTVQSMDREDRPATRILILGGGFAGSYTAYALQETLRGLNAQVAIVNRENFFVFYPLLTDVVGSEIETEDILTPIRLLVRKATLYVGDVTAIDVAERSVEIRHGLYRHRQQPRTLHCDHLVLALGGVPNTARIPGLAEYAFDIQRLRTAFALRNHLIDILEQGDIERDPAMKERVLTVVVVGGGANGVEVTAAIRDLLYDAVEYYHHIEPYMFRIILVHGGSRLLPDLPENLAAFAERLLRARGVTVMLNTRVVGVEPTAVHLSDGSTINSETVVGSVGVQPNPLVTGLPLPKEARGRIKVNDYLGVDGFPGIWALGDNALVNDPYTGQPYPQTAQHAIREARVVAHNIAATIKGEPLEPIAYKTRGQLVALGHRSAVLDLRGRTLSGLLAWFLWRSYYLMQLPRWEKRIRVAFDWAIDLVFPPTLVQLKVGQPAPMAERARAEAESEPAPKRRT